jgi:signal transduction histidine kinase
VFLFLLISVYARHMMNKQKESNEDLAAKNVELDAARAELASSNEKLEQRVKERTSEVERLLAHKDEFISQLGHDLKTPLTPLVALLPTIRNAEHDPKSRELLDVCIANVDYMKDLVTKTLQFERISSPNVKLEIRENNLREEISRIIVAKGAVLQRKNLRVENWVEEEVFAEADPFRLEELLDNLISNAIAFTPEGGAIIFDASMNGQTVTVSVKDTGVGMTQEQIGQVFNEFYKADKSRHQLNSQGLGLAICKRIVEKHGGRIWAESPGLGQGTTLLFTLKLANRKPQPEVAVHCTMT